MTNLLQTLPPAFLPYTDADIRAFGWEACVVKEMARRVRVLDLIEGDEELKEWVAETARRDVLFFLSQFGWSYDTRLDQPDTPLILFNSQIAYVLALVDPHGGPMLVEKSRDQGASVYAAAALGWRWLYTKGWNVGLLTRIGSDLDDKTYNSLFGKLDYFLSRLPPMLLPPNSIQRFGNPAPRFVNLLNGNVIRGSNTTRGTMRGFRFKRLVVDEAAHIEKMREMMSGLTDISPNLTLISSVNGLGNVFADIRFSREGYRSAPYFDPNRPKGTWGVIRLHYSDDPRKDADWVAVAKRGKSAEDWAQEQEIEYTRSTRYRIFQEFDPGIHVYTPEQWEQVEPFLSQGRLIDAWDFGSGTGLTCHVAGVYLEHEDLLIVTDYNAWRSTHWRAVADEYGLDGYRNDKNRGGTVPDKTIGDVAGTARDSSQASWIKNLASANIYIEGRVRTHFERSRQSVDLALREGRVAFAPWLVERRKPDIPSLVESCVSWKYKVTGDGAEAKGDKPDKNSPYSHLGDCVIYLCDELWGVYAVTQGRLATGRKVDTDPVQLARARRRAARWGSNAVFTKAAH